MRPNGLEPSPGDADNDNLARPSDPTDGRARRGSLPMRLVRCGTVIGVAAAIDHTAAVQLHVERWSPMMPQITADRPALRYTLAHFD